MYKVTKNEKGLVHCIDVPQLKDDKYSVELAPLGYPCTPCSEAEVKSALHSVLVALRGMHEAGYVHRDVRWGNILRDAQVCTPNMHVRMYLCLHGASYWVDCFIT